jgi:hypothetical protein
MKATFNKERSNSPYATHATYIPRQQNLSHSATQQFDGKELVNVFYGRNQWKSRRTQTANQTEYNSTLKLP